MESGWSDAVWDAPPDALAAQEIEAAIDEASQMDPLAAQEIEAAIDEASQMDSPGAEEMEAAINEASQMPIPGFEGGEPGSDAPTGQDADALWNGPMSGWSPASSMPRHHLSEAESAALLLDVLSRSVVYVEGGKLKVEPDPAEVEQWSAEKRQHVQDILGHVTAQSKNVQLIAYALEIENARLEELMAEYDEALIRAGYDRGASEVTALAQQIQELHTKIEDLSEQYGSLTARLMPGRRGPNPRM